VSWSFANDSGEETLVHTDLEFGAVEEAMQAGVEFCDQVDRRRQAGFSYGEITPPISKFCINPLF
jgi:hypothetical protein